ncbi:MAG: ATP-binding protein [Bacteroidota bacterium]
MDITSPFSFGQVVDDDDFTDRVSERKSIIANLSSGNSTILISPRRYGKSSLVATVMNDLAKKKAYAVTRLDLTASRSETTFLENFATQLLQANASKTSKWLNALAEKLKHIIPVISFGVGGPHDKVSFSFNWSEKKKTSREILQLPQMLAQVSGRQQIIAIDEFQNLVRFDPDGALQYEMRAHWQHQTDVSYCLFGSKRHMMEEIFIDTSAPFYNFGQIMRLGKIPEKYWTPFIFKKFAETGKPISEKYAAQISQLMQLHSEYTQFLSHLIWSECTHGPVKLIHMIRGLGKFMNSTSIHFVDLYDKISNHQVNVLKTVINQEAHLTSQDTLKKYKLGTSANALKARKALVKEDFLTKTKSGYSFINPAFELWFRKEVMGEDIIKKWQAVLSE